MTTPSQAAFEKEMKDCDRDLSKDKDGNFSDAMVYLDFNFWDVAWQAARKQALEESAAICKSFKGGGSNGIQAARVCAYNIEELLK